MPDPDPIPIRCRVIFDRPAEGVWNMAVDEALLTRAEAVLRFYGWRRPTLSLGYFQAHHAVLDEARWRDLPWIRRLTGGGAVLHDRELTYALVLPRGLPLTVRPDPLYDAVHRAIAGSLAELGARAGLRKEEARSAECGSPAFLCFARTDPHDIVFEGRKIGGSAQRRRRSAVLQHGSIVLQTSAQAPEITGLEELGGPGLAAEELARKLAQAIPRALDLEPFRGELQAAELADAAELVRSKYSLSSWNERVQDGDKGSRRPSLD